MNEEIDKLVKDLSSKELEGKKINKEPLCVLLGGLPGSGKTNLVKQIQAEYPERDFVVIDTDEYRKLHPDYETLRQVPEQAITKTSEFSNKIELSLIEKALEKHCDIISVTTLRETQAIDEILYNPAIEKGYKMEAAIMSVPIAESGLSAQNRYEDQIANGECPRFTPLSFIKSSHDGICNTIRQLQTKKDNPTLKVYNRNKGADSLPTEVYNSNDKNARFSCALEAFLKPVQNIEHADAAEQISELYKKKQDRLANRIEYESLKTLEESFRIEREQVRD